MKSVEYKSEQENKEKMNTKSYVFITVSTSGGPKEEFNCYNYWKPGHLV